MNQPNEYLINREGYWKVIEESEVMGKKTWKDLRYATEDDKYNIPRHPKFGDTMIIGSNPKEIL